MRIISLSVDGLQQATQRGLYDWLAEQDADVICLQDIRCLESAADDGVLRATGYNAYFFDAATKHYNGVVIYSRALPKALIYGFGFASGVDMDSRYLQIDFEHLSIGSLLAPSALSDISLCDLKAQFFDDLQAHLVKIARKRRNFIFCGNWAIAPTADDVSNPSVQQQQSGFLPTEQQWMSQLPDIGYIDAFRQGNTDKDEYSWWPSNEPGKGDAWRTDLQIVSASLKNHIEYSIIYKNQRFSSHLPVIVDYDIDLEPEY